MGPLYPQADKLLVGGLVDKTTGREMKSLFFLNDTAKIAYTLAKKTRTFTYMFD